MGAFSAIAVASLSERYEALIRVSQAVSAHRDPKELFCAMARELQQVVQFDGIVIAQYDQASNETLWKWCQVSNQDQPTPPPVPPDESITKWVFEHQQPLVIPSLDRETRFPRMVEFLKSKGFRSICSLPLATIHRKIGSLAVASAREDAYSPDEVRFLSLVAGQAALAIDDALNFEASRNAEAALQKKNERLKALLDLNNTIVSNLELHDLLTAISASLRSLMHCDGVSVALPDASDTGYLRLYALDFPSGKGLVREDAKIRVDNDSPAARAYRTGEPVSVQRGEPNWAPPLADAEGLNSMCHIALAGRNRTVGLLTLARMAQVPFSARDLEFLSLIANQIAIAVENALAYREIAELKDRLAEEKVYLEDEIRSELNFEEIVGRSAALRRVLQEIETVSPTDSTVLIYGETGTGKELIARAIHNLSARTKSNFVKLNCAAIPTGLLESEMFGHEKGAFTGAVAQRVGRFELAHRGTVFLDEVGEIPLELQPKLLRVLQEREFERLGSSRTLYTDARLIAATNRDLADMVEDQRFRADLFYRLNVFPVHVPALRERQDDIPLLVRHFVQHFARKMGKVVDTIPAETMNALVRYHWPGNIRELQNLVERAVILSPGPVLRVPLSDLHAQPAGSAAAPASRKSETLEEVERRYILETLDATDWVISGPRGAATTLGLKRSTLQARMDKLGIRRARTAAPVAR